jgi:hypothetical protein
MLVACSQSAPAAIAPTPTPSTITVTRDVALPVTKTVQATRTVSRTVKETRTVTKTATVTRTARPPAAPSTTAVTEGGNEGPYRQAVIMHTRWVVQDIRTADVRIRDGIGMDSTMSFLAQDFDELLSDGEPVGAPSSYVPTLMTLKNFANQASNEFAAGDNLDGSARYHVLRGHALTIVSEINSIYGTHFDP